MNNKSISVVTIDKEIEDLLKYIAEEENIRDYSITTCAGSERGDGYAGIITSAEIVGKDRANKKKSLNLIVKSASKSDALRAELPIKNIYEREIYMYDTVFTTFRLFEKEKGLPQSSFAPKFYKGNLTIKNEALILKNMKTDGYRLYERRIPMDENHVSLVMTEYGRMHALSLALRDQDPETFKKTLESMDDIYVKFMIESGFKDVIKQRCVKAQEALDINTDAKAIKIYESFVNSIDQFYDDLREAVDNYSVALHGDCWTNNMLFKYENVNESKPTKVSFIDFQGSRLGSPVLDLAYFFYACSSKLIINKLNYYLQLYYNSLSTYLRKLGSDPDKIFPYSVLQEHWNKYAKFGLQLAVLVIHVMLTEKDETIDFSEIAESGEGLTNALNYEIANITKYNDRVRHIILHFVTNKFI